MLLTVLHTVVIQPAWQQPFYENDSVTTPASVLEMRDALLHVTETERGTGPPHGLDIMIPLAPARLRSWTCTRPGYLGGLWTQPRTFQVGGPLGQHVHLLCPVQLCIAIGKVMMHFA